MGAQSAIETRKLGGWEEKIEALRANPTMKEEFLARLAAEKNARRKEKARGRSSPGHHRRHAQPRGVDEAVGLP